MPKLAVGQRQLSTSTSPKATSSNGTPILAMVQTTIEQQPAQSHGTRLANQLVGAQALAVLEPCLRPSNPLVVDPAATEQIIDEGTSSSDRTRWID